MDIKPGFYLAHWKDKAESRLIVVVCGVSPGYVFDVIEHIKEGETRLISDLKLHKKPIVFDTRIDGMDKLKEIK